MIAVTVSSPLGKLLHQYGDISNIPHKKKYASLVDWLEKHQSKLTPTFPGIEDDNMLVFFSLQSENELTDAGLQTLLSLPGIDGAYRKSEDSLPG